MMNSKFFFDEPIPVEMIGETWEKSFHVNFDTNYWYWRYQNNPYDERAYINYLAEGNTLAAYYSVSQCELIVKGQKNQKLALSNMTMTRPSYEGNGYFKKLASELYTLLATNDFVGVISFPVRSKSHYILKKHLSFEDISMFRTMKIDRSEFVFDTEYDYLKYESEYGVINEEVINIANELNFTDKDIYITRNVKNLKWRLIDNPSNQYYYLKVSENNQCIGILFFKYYENAVDIMECFYSKGRKYATLNIGVNYLLENYIQMINIGLNSYSKENDYLEKLGFTESDLKTYFCVSQFIENDDILDGSRWHVRFMDSDMY
jgi:hypothetical protein